MKYTRTVSTILVLSLLLAAPGQESKAGTSNVKITGVVRIADGAVLPRAQLTISETGSNLANRLVRCDKKGRFDVELPQGIYRIHVFADSSTKSEPDLVDLVAYDVMLDRDRDVTLSVERGTIFETTVVQSDGTAVPHARLDLVDLAGESFRTVHADANGWVRFVLAPNQSAFVTPTAESRTAMSRVFAYEDLSVDATGLASPLELERLVPEQASGSTRLLHRGAAPGPHYTIAFLAEGFTPHDEEFTDSNSNGRCDYEAYIDDNGNGTYDSNERFVDLNANGKRDTEPFSDSNGDGYFNQGEKELFFSSAVDSTRAMLGLPVYRELANYLDIYAIYFESEQAGSDFDFVTFRIDKDTHFNTSFRSRNYIFQVDNLFVLTEASRVLPEVDAVALLTLDPFNLGQASSGTIVRGFVTPTDEPSLDIAHEFGHNIAGLADEYFDHDRSPYSGDEPNRPNVTTESNVALVKWAPFVRASTPAPTPDGTPGIGLFEGGLYRRVGIYRPSFNCLMRRTTAVFCAVCADSMFLAVLSSLGSPPVSKPTITTLRTGERIDGKVYVGSLFSDLASVRRVVVLVDGIPTPFESAKAPFGVLIDTTAISRGEHEIQIAVDITGEPSPRVSDPVRVTVDNSSAPVPQAGRAERRGNQLTLVDSLNVQIPGAVLVLNGDDRFTLERVDETTVRVPKHARGSRSGSKLGRVLKRNGSAPAFLRNPDGRVSDTVVLSQ